MRRLAVARFGSRAVRQVRRSAVARSALALSIRCYLIRHPSRESPFPVRPFSLDQERPLFDRALLTAIPGREDHPFDSALERDVSEDPVSYTHLRAHETGRNL